MKHKTLLQKISFKLFQTISILIISIFCILASFNLQVHSFGSNFMNNISIYKSEKIKVLSSNFDYNIKENTENTKFEEIKEWNELRLRVGDVNTFLKNGTYLYHIQLEIPLSSSRQNLTVLQNWTDQVGWLEVRIDGQIY